MVQAACDTGAQSSYCPSTIDEVSPQIIALLPDGPAWDAARAPGSIMNKFWRGASGPFAYFNQRVCDMLNEFYCDSVVESFDQWQKEYALGEDCDAFGFNLCAKVTAQGGASAAYFTQVAAENGWVITVSDLSADPENVAGGLIAGCTQLGPTPVYSHTGSNLSYGDLCKCAFGSVVQHPEPQYWEHSATSQSQCWVPGSNLGQGPDVDESCCFIVGWYEPPPIPDVLTRTDACVDGGNTIYFTCPTQATPALIRMPCDTTGFYTEYSKADVWNVTVSMRASRAAQNLTPVDDGPTPQAGNFEAGCTPLCSDDAFFVLCFLEKIKPAHTTLVTNVDWNT